MTEKQAEGLQDNGVESFLRLNTVRGEHTHMGADNARLPDVRDSAKKQLDEGMILKLVQDVAQLQNERTVGKRPFMEESLGSEKASRFPQHCENLGQHLSLPRVGDAALPVEPTRSWPADGTHCPLLRMLKKTNYAWPNSLSYLRFCCNGIRCKRF